MAKLKNIIKQLSNHDYEAIHHSLLESNAEKSAYLLKSMREKSHSDTKIMEELGVNTNAYYTLRSRLYQKIEEYLLTQMESPRTDLLKRVSNISETIFTRKPAITIATLKRLEKELIDYDLSNELTVVYKHLKKLHINSPDFFSYSQSYNKHVAYMLAVDKAEDMLSEYFKKFGVFCLTGDEIDKLGLTLLNREMINVCNMYNSHRLYVYQACMNVFHRLFVEEDRHEDDGEPIEDILDRVEKYFKEFDLDTIYHHLEIVFEYLRLEYYNHYKVYKKAEKYYEEVNESIALLLSNYSLYTYPAQFLMTKVERCLRNGSEASLYVENDALFEDFEYDRENVPQYVNYVLYRTLSCYYANHFDEAAKWLNNLLNELSLKRYQLATIEIKSILALQYCLMQDVELFSQLVNSIQRQVRMLTKEDCSHITSFLKILKIAMSDVKRDKIVKIKAIASRISDSGRKSFSPTKYIVFDDRLINLLSEVEAVERKHH